MENQNEVTDTTNAVTNNDIRETAAAAAERSEIAPAIDRVNYEVVFFCRYNTNPRPLTEEVIAFFNNYGVVHHVNCPEGRNYAFIFMTSLNTTAEYRRTRATIAQIIHDMTPENRFHITVASSNRGNFAPQGNYYGQQPQQQVRPYGNYQTNRPRQYGSTYQGQTRQSYQNNPRPYVRNAQNQPNAENQAQYRRPSVLHPSRVVPYRTQEFANRNGNSIRHPARSTQPFTSRNALSIQPLDRKPAAPQN